MAGIAIGPPKNDEIGLENHSMLHGRELEPWVSNDETPSDVKCSHTTLERPVAQRAPMAKRSLATVLRTTAYLAA
ncbi:hypothetical protein CQ011_14275 [Arthrobacter sp. MYb213]|nr:hypothetical protein CQ011_14275 [Arthrobacter sp. MYb213]